MSVGLLASGGKRAVAALVCAIAVVGSSITTSCVPEFVFPEDVAAGGMGGGEGVPLCRNGALDPGETDKDCGGVCDPCDVGSACAITRDCQRPPAGDPSYADCTDGQCALTCLGDRGDCNERAYDGCETDLLTSRDHCGACGEKCSPKNAVGQCMNGSCLIKTDAPNQGCDPNFADCNRDPTDGCEVNLLQDPEHCGACEDAICSAENGTPVCRATPSKTECTITCSQGYADCDADKSTNNGCETNTDRSIHNCGACGKVCKTDGSENASAFCAADQEGVIRCGQTQCEPNRGDCDGDGECSDALDTVTHCGGCGLGCSVAHGTPGCDGMACTVESCDAGPDEVWADCDDLVATGCEVNTLSSPSYCGGCDVSQGGGGEDCSAQEGQYHITQSGCAQGACQVATCESPWLDCDGDFANGCEVNSQTDDANCGACEQDGGVCTSAPHVPGHCVAGTCNHTCDPGWVDLNKDLYGEASDGCEARDLMVASAGAWVSQDTGGSSGPSLTIQHTLQGAVGTERLVLVGVMCRDTATNCRLTKATYGSTQLTLLQEVFLVDSSAKIYFALDAELPEPGSYTVSLDKDDSWGSISAEVLEFNGAAQDQFSAAVGTGTNGQSCNTDGEVSTNLAGLPLGTIVYAVGGGNRSGGAAGGCTALKPFNLSVSRDADYIVFGSAYSDRFNTSDDFDTVDGAVAASLDCSGCDHSVMVAVGVRPKTDN